MSDINFIQSEKKKSGHSHPAHQAGGKKFEWTQAEKSEDDHHLHENRASTAVSRPPFPEAVSSGREKVITEALATIKKSGGEEKNFFSFLKKKQPENKEILPENKEPDLLASMPKFAFKEKIGNFFKKLNFFSRQKKKDSSPLPTEQTNKKVGEEPDVLGANLIKEEDYTFFGWEEKIIFPVILLLASVFLIGIAYWGISYWGAGIDQGDEILVEIESLDRKINSAKVEAAKVVDFRKRLEAAKFILDNHIYWTNFFDFLEKNTGDGIFYSGFIGGIDGKYQLSATAKSFNDVFRQISAIRGNEFVSRASTAGGDLNVVEGGQEVRFEMNFEVDKKIFKK